MLLLKFHLINQMMFWFCLSQLLITNVTQDSFWVMKLINDTTAVKINITRGIENDSVVQILNSNLKPDDKIILSGAYGLPDTAKVEIKK